MKRFINSHNGKITFINDTPSAPSPKLPVSEYLAKLIENAVLATGQSININSTSGGNHSLRSFHQFGMAVDINKINGLPIDNQANVNNVRKFQQIISQSPEVAECFGPFINLRKHGTKITQKPEMKIKHLNHLHISSQR